MAYDRYDSRGERGRSPDERYRSERDYGPRDRDERERGAGGRDERGFFERAGDEISSWFSDDDRDSGSRHGSYEREHGRYRGEGEPSGRGHGEHTRFENRDSRDRERMMRRDERDDRSNSGWLGGRDRSEDERGFFRSSSDRASERSGSMASGGRREERDYRPMTGDYGRASRDDDRLERDSYRSNYERDPYRRTSEAGSMHPADRHYHSWRQRQMEDLDRDYDDYRREHQSKFESEFGGWREKRQTKRQMLGQVSEHMEVTGNDGEHVGTIDKVAGDRIILTKSDPESGGVHHSLGCDQIDRVEDGKLVLDCSAEQAKRRWRQEGHSRALFEREDQGEDGPHMLDRSFSGTYRS